MHNLTRPDRRLAALACRLFASLACAAGLLMAPTHVRGESLLEAYKLALVNDPKYAAAKAESLANGMVLEQARAGFRPTVTVGVERTETRQRILRSQNPIFGAGVTDFPTSSDTLTITQPIFRKDVIERLAQAKAVARQANYTLLAAEQDLQLRTTANYLVVLAANDSLELARAEREAVGKALDLAREQLKMGLGTVTNRHDAAARFAVAQAREIEAQNRLSDAKQGLREVTGRVIDKLQVLRDDFPLETPVPADVERWVELAFEQNLALRARREAVEVAQQEIRRQQAGHWPTFNLVLNHNRRDSGSTLFGGGSEVQTTDLSLRMAVPLYEGGLTSAVTEEAVYRHEKAMQELKQEHSAVERAARGAYNGTLSGARLVHALKQSVESQEGALVAKQEGYRSGLFTLLPALDAQRDLYLAKRDYAQSRYDYLFNRLKLKQAAGTLSEADLLVLSAALR